MTLIKLIALSIVFVACFPCFCCCCLSFSLIVVVLCLYFCCNTFDALLLLFQCVSQVENRNPIKPSPPYPNLPPFLLLSLSPAPRQLAPWPMHNSDQVPKLYKQIRVACFAWRRGSSMWAWPTAKPRQRQVTQQQEQRQQVPLLMTKKPDSSLIQMLLSKHHLGTPPAPLHAPFAPLAGDSALCNFSAWASVYGILSDASRNFAAFRSLSLFLSLHLSLSLSLGSTRPAQTYDSARPRLINHKTAPKLCFVLTRKLSRGSRSTEEEREAQGKEKPENSSIS